MELSALELWQPASYFFLKAVIALIGVLVWLIIATTLVFRGGGVDKSNRVAHLYGYTVCLIAVVTFLFSTSSLIGSAIDLTNPLYAGYGFEPSLSSFEAYQATYRNTPFERSNEATLDTLSVETLRARWEALRTDRIARQRFAAQRSILTSIVLVAVSVTLFLLHWRWLRRTTIESAGTAA